MAQPAPNKMDDSTNPLQPGDPFKRRNFSKFALGICLITVLVLAAAIAYFFLSRNHQPTPTPSPSSRSAIATTAATAG